VLKDFFGDLWLGQGNQTIRISLGLGTGREFILSDLGKETQKPIGGV
jgi:hypothetical protein